MSPCWGLQVAPRWLLVHWRRKPASRTQPPTHRAPSSAPTLLLWSLLIMGLLPASASALDEWTDLDSAAGGAILPIAVVSGILNIVSANIAHSPSRLATIDHLMVKHNWHIVLLQEMGVV